LAEHDPTARRLAAILSADGVGYSRLMAEDEAGTIQTLNAYREAIGSLVEQHRGRIVDSPGDNLLAEFPNALDAVQCAVEIQGVLRVRNQSLAENRRMSFRIGLHLGDITAKGDRIYGDGVNITARLEGLAEPGGICISATVHDQVRKRLDSEFEDLGQQQIKNITEPVHVYRIRLETQPLLPTRKSQSTEQGRLSQGAAASLGAPEKSQRTSVVVLPFDNLSPDPGDAYFSDGLTEEIITNLAYLRSLRVISRSTAMVLKDTQKDVRTIGRDLDVEYVLEGSVRKAGDSLRITAQLIDARSDEHVWAERHEGTIGDIFEVQERIAKRIVHALRLKLSPAEESRLVDRPIADPKAYDIWILAMHEGRKFSQEGTQRGIQLAERALEMMGDNARVYASLGYLYYTAYDVAVWHQDEALDRAERYASQALELDPTLPLALFAKGLVRYKRGDIPGFVRHARPAAKLGGDSDAQGILTFVLAEVGKLDEARRCADEALAVDPLIFFPWCARSAVDLFGGDPRAALERIRAARDRLAPREPFAGWWVAQMAAYAGEERDAHEEYSKVAQMDAGLWSDYCELFRRALEKDRNGVMQQLDATTLPDSAKTDEYYPLFLANALAHVGEYDEALHWLERSIGWGFTNYQFLSKHNRFLEPLRCNQRFQSLMEQAQEEQESFDT
jgi:adenylate cyclase